MKPSRWFLLALVAAVSLAFVWLVAPFSGAILWAVVAAVLAMPVFEALLARLPGRRNAAAGLTLLGIVALIVVPALGLGAALVAQAGALYAAFQNHQIDPARLFVESQRHLPGWVQGWLATRGLADVASLRAALGNALESTLRAIGPQILSLGQGTLGLFLQLGVALYLAFFLLRDGRAIAERVERAIPLPPAQRALLIEKCVTTVRATIKGSLIVAALQGLIGGLAFWLLGLPGALLWGVAMGFFSLFPAVGTGIVWVPMALYLLASGAVAKGLALAAIGVGVISTVDNVVRPVLVGRDTRIPDYMVLVATLGGFELMGFNGFVLGPVIAALFIAAWRMVAELEDEGEVS